MQSNMKSLRICFNWCHAALNKTEFCLQGIWNLEMLYFCQSTSFFFNIEYSKKYFYLLNELLFVAKCKPHFTTSAHSDGNKGTKGMVPFFKTTQWFRIRETQLHSCIDIHTRRLYKVLFMYKFHPRTIYIYIKESGF